MHSALILALVLGLGFKIAAVVFIGSVTVFGICMLVALARRHDESTRGKW